MLRNREDIEAFVAGETLEMHVHVQVRLLVIEERDLNLLCLYHEGEVAVGAVEGSESEVVVFQIRNDLELELIGETSERHDLAGKDGKL
jgi:hypothetical protein